MTDTNTNETTPDQLMKTFEGKSLKSIILFTIVIHAVLLIGTSVPYLFGSITGEDNAELGEEERLQTATKEATAAIREIAERYQLTPQELSSRFSDGAPKAPAPANDETEAQNGEEPEADPEGEGGEPGSIIEQEINKAEKGPELPPVEDEDLFK